MIVDLISIEYNRNGSSSAESFMCVHFKEKSVPKEFSKGMCGNQFIATFCTDNDGRKMDYDTIRITNIKNPSLSFRGDYFWRALNDAMEAFCITRYLTEKSWIAAAFPNQYKEKEKV